MTVARCRIRKSAVSETRAHHDEICEEYSQIASFTFRNWFNLMIATTNWGICTPNLKLYRTPKTDANLDTLCQL
eukprot:2643040-Rhodomonas_salina.1